VNKRSQPEISNKDITSAGKEANFFLPWGSLMSAYAQQRIVLWIMAPCLMVSVLGNVFQAYQSQKRETWVFVRDSLGNVIQADPDAFLRAGEGRDEMEVKGFALRFCRDAFEFTPLDVQDRVQYALRYVEPKAHGTARNSLRLAERAKQVQSGYSVKIGDDIEKGRIPEISIIRYDPCEVLAIFTRNAIDSYGNAVSMPPLAVRLILKMVPRSPNNPNGLIVTDITTTNS